MASWGKVEFGQLKEFQKQLEQIQQKELDAFLTSCTKELAARLLAQVIKRTPVGDYSGDAYISKREKKKHRNTPRCAGDFWRIRKISQKIISERQE